MSDAPTTDPCDGCGEPTTDALARTVRLSVDRANIDTQRLCPFSATRPRWVVGRTARRPIRRSSSTEAGPIVVTVSAAAGSGATAVGAIAAGATLAPTAALSAPGNAGRHRPA